MGGSEPESTVFILFLTKTKLIKRQAYDHVTLAYPNWILEYKTPTWDTQWAHGWSMSWASWRDIVQFVSRYVYVDLTSSWTNYGRGWGILLDHDCGFENEFSKVCVAIQSRILRACTGQVATRDMHMSMCVLHG